MFVYMPGIVSQLNSMANSWVTSKTFKKVSAEETTTASNIYNAAANG